MEGKKNLCGKDGKCKGADSAQRAGCMFSLDDNGNADGCTFLAFDYETCMSQFAQVSSLLTAAQAEAAPSSPVGEGIIRSNISARFASKM
ncbi:MAG: hypothetical protein LLG40_11310 [Deltaproteobacteria bacterium]|nr:hypothetical protein [Deltaproteobacteria bacterium]